MLSGILDYLLFVWVCCSCSTGWDLSFHSMEERCFFVSLAGFTGYGPGGALGDRSKPCAQWFPFGNYVTILCVLYG